MTATLRKWATDLTIGVGIAVLGLVLLAGGGKAFGVVPVGEFADANFCPTDELGLCVQSNVDCPLPNKMTGTCKPSKNCPCVKK